MTTTTTKSETPLVGIDGNAFTIIGTVDKGLRKAVIEDMQSGDYDHLLAVAVEFTTNYGAGGPEEE